MCAPTRLKSLWAVLVLLAACGGSNTPPAAQTSANPPAQNSQPSSQPTAAANPAPAIESAGEETQPAQISETDEESGGDPASMPAPSATPTLRLAAVAPQPKPSRFQEGVHYRRLSPTQPTGTSPGQIEIVEVFWYGSPLCFGVDPKLDTWRGTVKPGYVTFTRLPATWNDIERFHARLYYTAEALGKLEGLHAAIFREIHTANNPLNTAGSASVFFTANGVGKAEFQKAFGSSAVDVKLQRADVLNRRYRAESAPYFVINGKFTTDVAMAGGDEQLLSLLNELAIREHGD